MAAPCGVKAAKVALGAFNVLFWLVGGVLLALGAWIFLDHTKERMLQLAAPPTLSAHALFYIAYALLALGCGALAAGVLGCCGALQGSRCLLVTYFALVLTLVLGALAVAAATLVTRVQVLSDMQKRLQEQLPARYSSQRSDNYTVFSDTVDMVQYKLKCCGARGPDDYVQSRWWNETRAQRGSERVPLTCCVLTNEEVGHSGSPLRVVSRVFGGTVEEPWQHPQPRDEPSCQLPQAPENARHKKGCAAALAAWYQREAVVLIAAAIGSAVFQVVGLVLAVCLCRALADDLEDGGDEDDDGDGDGDDK